MIKKLALLPLVALSFTSAIAQEAPMWPPNGNDVPAKFTPPVDANADYIKREVMIPMRDGVKLYTVIVIPKGATNAPIVLTRTPYNAKGRAKRADSRIDARRRCRWPTRSSSKAGYIRVYQDVRGKYGSEGDYVMTRPVVGPLNHDQGRPHHRRLRHDRLAGEQGEPARIERQGRHDRLVLRRLHRRHGAAQPAPGAEGRGAAKARWSTAGWATTGSTTAPSATPTSTTSAARPATRARARRRRRGGYDDYDNFPATPARPATGRRRTGSTSCPIWNRMIGAPRL